MLGVCRAILFGEQSSGAEGPPKRMQLTKPAQAMELRSSTPVFGVLERNRRRLPSPRASFLGLWESWRRAPWIRPGAVSERLAWTTGKALVMAAFVASAGEIARRALPTGWDLHVMLATVIGVTVGTVVVFRSGEGVARSDAEQGIWTPPSRGRSGS